MNTAFIIAEYNPFHNGHQYHLQKTAALGADRKICIMSGNFVQRSEAAAADKFLRAKTAILGGADLVLELPVKFAVSNAKWFASGAVEIIRATGINGFISCGASASAEQLSKLSRYLCDEEIRLKIRELCENSGLSFPAAQYRFIRDNISENAAELLLDPNNVLALEYLKAAQKKEPPIPLFTVERKNTAHDSMLPAENTASAKYIRTALCTEKGFSAVADYIPEAVLQELLSAFKNGRFSINSDNFNTAAMSRLYTLTAADFLEIENVKQGLENKIIKALQNSVSLNELYDNIKSKRYTHSRIRQIIISAALGVKKTDLQTGASFIRVLAFNDKGRELIREIKKNSSLPVITNISELKDCREASRDSELSLLADKLYNLCLPNPEPLKKLIVRHAQYIKS